MLDIYQASVKNVRELKKNKKQINLLVNKCIRDNSKNSITSLTKIYALLYSSFAETCFLKMIHTPHGLSNELTTQIMSQRNLSEKWNKCLDLTFQQIEKMPNIGEVQNKRQKLNGLIEEFILEPSQLRNKIAHGQWKIALNSENNKINEVTTKKINNIDFIRVDVLFKVYEKISQVVEDLIESPYKTHFRDFYKHLTELDQLLEKTKNWTMESKIELITQKKNRQN